MYCNLQHFLVLIICILIMESMGAQNVNVSSSPRPAIAKVGALLAYNSTIGRVARKAIELAVEDINGSNSVLNGTRLVLTMADSHCSAFTGTAAALELMKEDAMAIVGPQSSVLAHVVAHVANEIQVPLLSFAATDPTLSSSEYPYFLRVTHSDFSEMTAAAAVIGHYGWREVVAVYIDDDYGRNGIFALRDALVSVGAKIVYKAVFRPGVGRSDIANRLVQLALMEARVLVVHMNPDSGLTLFSEAKHLGMLSAGYVWIATDWLSSVLDSTVPSFDIMNSIQGVIALRAHTATSDQQAAFTARWDNLLKSGSVDTRLNVFGLYAYDAVWTMAHAIDTFLREGGNISFTAYPKLFNGSGVNSELAEFKVFSGGPQLKKNLLQSNFTGLSGPVQLDKNGDLLGSTFEIINVVGTGFRKVSYWSNHSGLSVIPSESRPSSVHNQPSLNEQLYDVIWPGESKSVPRGWVFPINGKPLVIGVPRKTGFKEFVTVSKSSNMAKGFCIDVFVAAVNLLPYAFSYTFEPFGTGNSTPNYNDLIERVASKQKFDAAVGDIAILTNRSMKVDFTQPYAASGLVVVAPVKEINSKVWSFLQPFTVEMWCTTGASFVVIGVVVCILERRKNSESGETHCEQIRTFLWFIFSTLFFAHREEDTRTVLGRALLTIWLFVVLIITSSYTANLTSILTVQQLSPTIQGINSLIEGNTAIGYQTGSFVRNYLTQELNIAQPRLVPLDSPERYAEALSQGPGKGGVAAIVDELPYVELFLSAHCGFRTVGQPFTKGGWGFAFPKDSQLAIDLSTALLTLSENGELQRIHDKWLNQNGCSSDTNEAQSNQLGLKSFRGLFLISGVASLAALFAFLCRMICLFIHDQVTGPHPPQSCRECLRSFVHFLDKKQCDRGREFQTGGPMQCRASDSH